MRKAKQFAKECIRYVFYNLQKRERNYFEFDRVIILANPYVEHVAVSLQNVLSKYVETRVSSRVDRVGHNILYIVLCPQFHGFLPRRRIVYNFEQPSSIGCFTKSNLLMFRNSLGIFDYREGSLLFHWPQLTQHYRELRVAANLIDLHGDTINAKKKEYDLVFYGCMNKRRELIINTLRNRFSVLVLEGVTGKVLETKLSLARACINLHSYDDSPFESVRFFQCLNLHLPTISEYSVEQTDYAEYEMALRFIDNTTDTNSLLNIVGQHLADFSDKKIDYPALRRLSHDRLTQELLSGLATMGADLANRTFYPRLPEMEK